MNFYSPNYLSSSWFSAANLHSSPWKLGPQAWTPQIPVPSICLYIGILLSVSSGEASFLFLKQLHQRVFLTHSSDLVLLRFSFSHFLIPGPFSPFTILFSPSPPRPHTHTRACSVIINSGCALVSLRTFLKILIPALPPPPPTPPFWFNREVPALVIFKAPEIILIVAKVKNHPFSIQFLKRSLRLLFVLSHLSFLYHCRLAFLSLKSTVTQ